jgi:hypothetical protein
MSSAPDPYVKTSDGDLITAALFNGVQSTIRQDIAAQVKQAVGGIKSVDQAGDSAKLGGKTPKELEESIVQRVLSEIPKHRDHRLYFKRLTKDQEKVIEHNLYRCPLIDIYQLDYFPVICATGESRDDRRDAYVNFYLYHSSENRFKSVTQGSNATFEIEPTDGRNRPFRIPFTQMLQLYNVPFTDSSSLDDLETEFWKRLFESPPNDEFDEDQYCHSPWFEKCCGEHRTVGALKKSGGWNDIMFQMRPRKVTRFPQTPFNESTTLEAIPSARADVMAMHFDFNSIGLRLLSDPLYPSSPVTSPPTPPNPAINIAPNLSAAAKRELKIMLLLKV